MSIDISTEINGLNVRIYSYQEVADVNDDNIDIFVDIDVDTFSGQFHTIDNVKNRLIDGSYPYYFFDLYSVIVPDLSVQSIENAVRNLICENEIATIFCKQLSS